jgi:hypothetical protein
MKSISSLVKESARQAFVHRGSSLAEAVPICSLYGLIHKIASEICDGLIEETIVWSSRRHGDVGSRWETVVASRVYHGNTNMSWQTL